MKRSDVILRARPSARLRFEGRARRAANTGQSSLRSICPLAFSRLTGIMRFVGFLFADKSTQVGISQYSVPQPGDNQRWQPVCHS